MDETLRIEVRRLWEVERLIAEWYQATPSLRAIQVLDRLRSYGYPGGYGAVKTATLALRKKRREAFFELSFLPGEDYGK